MSARREEKEKEKEGKATSANLEGLVALVAHIGASAAVDAVDVAVQVLPARKCLLASRHIASKGLLARVRKDVALSEKISGKFDGRQKSCGTYIEVGAPLEARVALVKRANMNSSNLVLQIIILRKMIEKEGGYRIEAGGSKRREIFQEPRATVTWHKDCL